MNVADEVKRCLSGRQVGEFYGFEPNRAGYISCPFHHEKTASLMLYKEAGRGWYCFGCNQGGSVIDFVMALFGLSFQQAVIRLSFDFKLGLAPTRATPQEASEILAERRAEAARREQERVGYAFMASEFRYWQEAAKGFAPTWETGGSFHPLYVEAVKRLPYLEYWLDEHLGR